MPRVKIAGKKMKNASESKKSVANGSKRSKALKAKKNQPIE
jgi:hypothetical protein